MYGVLTSLFVAATLMGATFSRADPVLVMAEEPGCMWCAAWNRDIGPIYGKTGEGAAALGCSAEAQAVVDLVYSSCADLYELYFTSSLFNLS